LLSRGLITVGLVVIVTISLKGGRGSSMLASCPTSSAVVVGENETRRQKLGHLLMLHGWMVRWDVELSKAILRVKRETPHLVLFDWCPIQKAALDDMRRMHDETLVPLVVVGTHATDEDAACAIEVGAEDFIFEPFHLRLFLVRCAAVRRRSHAPRGDDVRIGPRPRGSECSKHWNFGPLVIDASTRQVTIDGRTVALTAAEFSILARLARTPGVPITDHELVTQTLHEAFRPDSSIARFHIHRLRRKLGRYHYMIESVRPRGYRLSIESQRPIADMRP
jgi:DNA-binding response OmpR family regulator